MGIFRKTHFQTYNIDIGRGGPIFWYFRNFFFIARAPSRIMTNPRRRVGSFFENMNLEPQMGPVTFQNSKIVIFGGYSLWRFSKYKSRLLNSNRDDSMSSDTVQALANKKTD